MFASANELGPVNPDRPSDAQPAPAPQNGAEYVAPTLFAVGNAEQLLQGSGRHKNDDTGSRGFEVG
jgi:hypothetical protein